MVFYEVGDFQTACGRRGYIATLAVILVHWECFIDHALCSNTDPFNPYRGKQIAVGRVKKKVKQGNIWCWFEPEPPLAEQLIRAMDHYVNVVLHYQLINSMERRLYGAVGRYDQR
jgi:hypothetical protein